MAAPRQVSSVSLLQATKRGAAAATACARGLTGLGFRCRVLDSTGELTTTTDAVIACDATSVRALSRLQPAAPVVVALVRATGLDTVELLSEGSPIERVVPVARALLAPSLPATREARPGRPWPDGAVVLRPVEGTQLAATVETVLGTTPSACGVIVLGRDEPTLRDERVLFMAPDERDATAVLNRACRMVTGDVVLLEAGAELAPGWFEQLRAVALTRWDTATVSPLSGGAGPFAIPDVGSTLADMDSLVSALSSKERPTAPTGDPTCMYITRRAFNEIGYFDEFAFPDRLGAEADFCARAVAAGLVNLVDDGTFVRRAPAPPQQVPSMLSDLHPSLAARTEAWERSEPLVLLRDAVEAALAGGEGAIRAFVDSRPSVLYVLHAGSGGTPATNADLMHSLTGRFRCTLLRCDLERWELRDAAGTTVREWTFSTGWDVRTGVDPERAQALREAIAQVGAQIVHIRSFLALAPEYVRVVREEGPRVVVSFHDFYAVCPTIQLLDENYRYCGGACTEGPGPCPMARYWFGTPMPDLKHSYVFEWRRRMAAGLDAADRFITTSQASAEVIRRYFSSVIPELRVIEHGRDTGHYEPIAVAPDPGQPQRIACFGALGHSKGIGLIEEVMKLDRVGRSRFEFHFAGTLHGKWYPERWGGIAHGPYSREELSSTLRAIRPSYALVASIWPETYCHTLTESWALGLPVFASDIGTIRERVLARRGGWLLDHTDPEAWYARMCQVADNAEEWAARRTEIQRAAPRTVDEMSRAYADLYEDVLAVDETQSAVAP